ncbi:hypothetical protein BH23VER1_BH23VER1_06570 [soil metagenome]
MIRKVDLGDCPLGKGIFARFPIASGEVVFFLTGKFLTLEEALQQQDEGANTVGIGSGRYIDPGFPTVFINHSCDPNAGIVDDLTFIALRDIAKGEEVRFDYSTALMERLWTMECACGTAKCRGVIQDFDLLPEALQQDYLRRKIVQSYIVDALAHRRETVGKPVAA